MALVKKKMWKNRRRQLSSTATRPQMVSETEEEAALQSASLSLKGAGLPISLSRKVSLSRLKKDEGSSQSPFLSFFLPSLHLFEPTL